MMFYPVSLNLKGKRAVIIGGGEVAERKAVSLLETGAQIVLVSPEVTPRLASMATAKRIEFRQRAYTSGDCAGAALVLSATDDPAVSRAVWEEASAAGILVNTADQPALCDFILPAVVRRGDLTVAISTGGASPALAARLRAKLSRALGPEYAELLEILAAARPEIQRRVGREEGRKALHYRILDSDIIISLKNNDRTKAENRLREIIEDFARQEETS